MKNFWTPFLFILAISCSGPAEEKIPASVIPPEKMGPLLAEVQFLNAVHEDRFVKVNNLQTLAQKDFVELLDSFSVTPGHFDSSMQWYSGHPELLEQVYDDALSILTERLSSLEANSPLKDVDPEGLQKPKTITLLGRQYPVDEKGNIIKPASMEETKKAQ